MSNKILRMRFISFKDAANQPFTDILLYIKKLKHSLTSESAIKLEEKDPTLSIILTFNETFDLAEDEEYFQILFIESRSKPKVIGDIVFWCKYLLDLVNNQETQSKLFCNARLERDYVLEYSLQLVDNSTLSRKMSDHQSIRGHVMIINDFKHPVYCTICNQFIWGLYQQGYKCLQCSLVTHPNCHQHVPFWCQKSPSAGPGFVVKNRPIQFHTPHVFKQYEAPFFRSVASGDHTYCNHCGSHVLRNALKCKKCHFIVHKQCQSNVPPMCQIKYHSVAKALTSGVLKIDKLSVCSDIPISKTDSLENSLDTTSLGSMWFNSLPKGDLNSLPKFSDFKFIGRLGQGRYANVYCVQHIPSEEYVAIKVIDGLIQEARHQFEVERRILFEYSHGNPYMIKGYCSFHQGSKLFLVMDLVKGDTLYHKIHKKKMSEGEISFYLAEIISVLQYLHSNQIIYRDLKLEHVIINSDGHIRIVDYGLGRLLKTSDAICRTICGTYGYLAPEVRDLDEKSSKTGYSYAVDYWAVGVILAQMLCGEQFDIHPTENTFNFAETLQLSRHISSEARSCLIGLLEIDPEKRLGSLNSPHGSIRDHSFFKIKKINWQKIDKGLCKPIYTDLFMSTNSDTSADLPLPTLPLDRGTRAKADWMAAGESTCTENEEEEFKLFDYVNQSESLFLI